MEKNYLHRSNQLKLDVKFCTNCGANVIVDAASRIVAGHIACCCPTPIYWWMAFVSTSNRLNINWFNCITN
jgi:ribosomal protein S27AE